MGAGGEGEGIGGNRRGGEEGKKTLYILKGIFEYGVGKASWSDFESSSVWTGKALQRHIVLV